MSDLTRADRLWIAAKLMSRASDKYHALNQAIDNKRHPELIRQIREDIDECMRIARILKDVGDE